MDSRTNLISSDGFQAGNHQAMENRHRDCHLSIATAFYNCVAQCCEVFGGNCAIAAYWGTCIVLRGVQCSVGSEHCSVAVCVALQGHGKYCNFEMVYIRKHLALYSGCMSGSCAVYRGGEMSCKLQEYL